MHRFRNLAVVTALLTAFATPSAWASRGSIARRIHRAHPLIEVIEASAVSTFKKHGEVRTHESGKWPAADQLHTSLQETVDPESLHPMYYRIAFDNYCWDIRPDQGAHPYRHVLISPWFRWGLINDALDSATAKASRKLMSTEIRGRDPIRAALQEYRQNLVALIEAVETQREAHLGRISVDALRAYGKMALFALGGAAVGAVPPLGAPVAGGSVGALIGSIEAAHNHWNILVRANAPRFIEKLDSLLEILDSSAETGTVSLLGTTPRLVTPIFYHQLQRAWRERDHVDLKILADETLWLTHPHHHWKRLSNGMVDEMAGNFAMTLVDHALIKDPESGDNDVFLFSVLTDEIDILGEDRLPEKAMLPESWQSDIVAAY